LKLTVHVITDAHVLQTFFKQLGYAQQLAKNNFRTKIAGVWASGEPQNVGPLLISTTVAIATDNKLVLLALF